jgi:hypothetical protein
MDEKGGGFLGIILIKNTERNFLGVFEGHHLV